MPPRRIPGPKQPNAQAVLRLVASGLSVPKAAEKCGLQPATVWKWILSGKSPEPPRWRPWDKDRRRRVVRMSRSLWEACIEYSRQYDEARKERAQNLAEAALDTIKTAATEGFTETKIRRKIVGDQVVEEVREVKRGQPQWTAAAWYLERTIPEEYGRKDSVSVHTDFTLREGEAEAVIAACNDDERAAIEKGDTKTLAIVLARVREERGLK